ncbi:LLM class flavin-dependent oxidoreductase [Lysinibacter sp. HNR]|uniref:LLM class flavin-dependent oxidoreductase n=1 Tax=Lysinibacter sp. HNR TaxID=3031408 RepID=UPI002434BE5B|nr:LLM class flavin-dependent oxidoreductase [Lysinibacter sp. HNR]WGD36259.1 LLM class flavin-dependent oxidoreductase [Lysinibacter sp. HNR]
MELGIFSLADVSPDTRPSDAARTDDIVGYGLLAEKHGLDVFGVGEHHGAGFAVSSPAVVLAAVAGATSRIALTTASTVLSVLDPVRVYEDFATLNLVSKGRAEVIAGRSAFAEPFAIFGEDVSQYDEIFAEKLDLLLRLREEPVLNWDGRFRTALRNAVITPRDEQGFPVWVGLSGSASSAERAGLLGLPMALGLLGGTIDRAKRVIDVYRDAGERAGHAEETLRVAISSHFYVGESPEAALKDFFPYYRSYLANSLNARMDMASMQQLAARWGALMVGGPEQVAEKILDLKQELGVERLLGFTDLGGAPRELVNDSIARFGDLVAPIVRA